MNNFLLKITMMIIFLNATKIELKMIEKNNDIKSNL